MTMPKFEPVAYETADHQLLFDTRRKDIRALYSFPQLAAAYEAGKQEAEAANMDLTLQLKVADATLFVLSRKFPEVKAAIDAAVKILE